MIGIFENDPFPLSYLQRGGFVCNVAEIRMKLQYMRFSSGCQINHNNNTQEASLVWLDWPGRRRRSHDGTLYFISIYVFLTLASRPQIPRTSLCRRENNGRERRHGAQAIATLVCRKQPLQTTTCFPTSRILTCFSGDRDGDRGAGSLTDRSSELFESISPTVSVSSSSNSPIMPGEQHAALSGGKLLLPIPTNSGNSSQSSFAMSEV